MKFVQALKPVKSNDLFNLRLTALTFITFLIHWCIVYFSDYFYRELRLSNEPTYSEELFIAGYLLFFIYLIFVLVPARYIFMTKIPLVLKYILVISIPIVIFKGIDEKADVFSEFAVYTLPVFCLFELYGRVHKKCEEELEAESESD